MEVFFPCMEINPWNKSGFSSSPASSPHHWRLSMARRCRGRRFQVFSCTEIDLLRITCKSVFGSLLPRTEIIRVGASMGFSSSSLLPPARRSTRQAREVAIGMPVFSTPMEIFLPSISTPLRVHSFWRRLLPLLSATHFGSRYASRLDPPEPRRPELDPVFRIWAE